jgi:hypothetical protein
MSESITKTVLLNNIQSGYNEFAALIAPLSEEQMTIPAVNDHWTVKDNVAHLTAWQSYVLNQLRGLIDGKEPPAFMPGLSEDEINVGFYEENKERPLAEIMADFHLSYQRVLAGVQGMSEETLNAPFPWRKDGNAVWGLIAGNTFEHYEEHGNIIRLWLGRS